MLKISSLIKSIILFLLFYVSLEEFFLKWIPVSDSVFESLHLISDFFIILIAILYLMISDYKLKLSLINLSLIIFALLSLLSLILSSATIFAYFVKIWVLLRYIILFYILMKIKMTHQDVKRFYSFLGFILNLQLFIGLLLLLDVQQINQFFQAREGVEKIIFQEESIKGTFKFGVFYGFLILVSFVIVFPNIKNVLHKLVTTLMSFIFLYYSGSRLVVLGFFGYLVYFGYQKNRSLTILSSVAIFGILLSIILSFQSENVGSLLGLFSFEFWSLSYSYGRLGIFNIFPMFFESGLKEILIGFSYDADAISSFLFQNYSSLSKVLQNNPIVGIEDVYWIAFMYYYGLLGFGFYIIFYFSVMRKLNRLSRISPDYQKAKLQSIFYLMVFALLAGFINQIFYIKAFSFYFWIFLGLAMNPISYKKL